MVAAAFPVDLLIDLLIHCYAEPAGCGTRVNVGE